MVCNKRFIISKDRSYMKGFTRNGDVFLFSLSDYNIVKKYRWHIAVRGYASTNINGSAVTMHNLLIKDTDGFDIDHINGDKLDNRRENLRVCTHQENMFNQNIRSTNTSGYIGVSLMKRTGKYEAYLHHDAKKHYLGLYDNAIEAALARDKAAKEYFGEFARLNFPEKSDVYALL